MYKTGFQAELRIVSTFGSLTKKEAYQLNQLVKKIGINTGSTEKWFAA